MNQEHEQETHSSYGILAFNRASCSDPEPLFGSSIGHRNIITLRISTGRIDRHLSKDWIFPDKMILEADMSPTQFADAITGLNAGSGTPITIRYSRQGSIEKAEPCPFKSKVEQFNQEFADSMKEMASWVDDAIAEARELKVRKSLQEKLEMLKQHIGSNVPFVNKQFTEQMEQTIKEAKGEVEAFVTNLVHQYGIDAIREQAPQLEEATGRKQLSGCSHIKQRVSDANEQYCVDCGEIIFTREEREQ